MSARVLLVEDDRALRIGLQDALEGEGYRVEVFGDGDRAHDRALEGEFDLLVLDLMLPGRSGLEILRSLRDAGGQQPVLLLTARSDESDKVLGLELGADDYVTKPFGQRELLARVKALLRRHGPREEAAVRSFALGPLHVDLERFELQREGATHSLSPKEAELLALLYRADGRPMRRAEILDRVWGSGLSVGVRTVDTHVLNLRQKLEPDPKAPRYLQTVHGVGYRLLREDAPPAGAS